MNTAMEPAGAANSRALELEQVDWEDAIRRHAMETDIQLNAAFVEAVGQETAERFRDALIRVGTECRHHERAEISKALRAAFAQIGVEVGATELDSYADEISRSEAVTAHL